MRVYLGKDVRIKRNIAFLRVPERRLYIYFQVFTPSGLTYTSPECHSGVSRGTSTSDPTHPFQEGGVGLGRPLKRESPSGQLKCRLLL